MKKLLSILLACVLLFGMVSCTADNGDETTGTPAQTTAPQDETTEGGATDETTPADTTESQEPVNKSPFGISMSDLHDRMQPLFGSKTIQNETIMFLDEGDVRTLLYPIDTIISVKSYTGQKEYKEGVDYELVDGKIKVLEGSSIPCITKEKFYNSPGSRLKTMYNGQEVLTYWGEDLLPMYWQVSVTYTHSREWKGFKHSCQSDIYENFIKKLQNGEDVTVIFSGDSITAGANASYNANYPPNQHPYPMLFCEALADLFDYTVKYIQVKDNLTDTCPRVPTKDYVPDTNGEGTRGTITYINTAVGGWNSAKALSNIQRYVLDYIDNYGCDLFVAALGMNDTNNTALASNMKSITDLVLGAAPKTSVVLLSTMVCHPYSTNYDASIRADQRYVMKDLASAYRADGIACGVCDMGSVSLSILERKEFHDCSGNNINHPNDFFGRVYAQTLLQTVIGYENMG